jgi:hypothetical protein
MAKPKWQRRRTTEGMAIRGAVAEQRLRLGEEEG